MVSLTRDKPSPFKQLSLIINPSRDRDRDRDGDGDGDGDRDKYRVP